MYDHTSIDTPQTVLFTVGAMQVMQWVTHDGTVRLALPLKLQIDIDSCID